MLPVVRCIVWFPVDVQSGVDVPTVVGFVVVLLIVAVDVCVPAVVSFVVDLPAVAVVVVEGLLARAKLQRWTCGACGCWCQGSHEGKGIRSRYSKKSRIILMLLKRFKLENCEIPGEKSSYCWFMITF